MTFSTGEFAIPKLGRANYTYKRTACIFKDHLHTVNFEIDTYLFLDHVSVDLRRMEKKDACKFKGTNKINVDYLKDDRNWKKEQIFKHTLPEAFGLGVGLAHNSENMFMVYTERYGLDENAFLRARMYTPEKTLGDKTIAGKWDAPIELALRIMPENNVQPILAGSGVPSVSFFGEHQMIVAVPNNKLLESYDPQQGFVVLLFDTRDMPTEDGEKWLARSYRQLLMRKSDVLYESEKIDVNKLEINTHLMGWNIDIDWFVVAPRGSGADEPEYNVAINFIPNGATYNNSPIDISLSCTLPLPLKPDDSGEIDEKLAFFPQSGPTVGKPIKYYVREGLETGLKRDPCGRLRRFVGPTPGAGSIMEGKIGSIFSSTVVLPTAGNSFGDVVFPGPQYSVTEGTRKTHGAFYFYNSGKTEEKKANNQGNKVDIPVLEFILYGENKCQVRQYGTIRQLKYTAEPIPAKLDKDGKPVMDKDGKPEKSDKPKYIVGGYFDSPIPFPKQNYNDLPPGVEKEIGDFSFKSATGLETENSELDKWTVGFETDGKTTKGSGPAWKVAVDGGQSSVEKAKVETLSRQTLPVTATVKKPEKDAEDALSDSESIKITVGSGVASYVSSIFNITCYQFLDPDGNVVNGALTKDPAVSAKLSEHLISMKSAGSAFGTFKPFLVDSGDLESYTPRAINNRMKKLGYDGENYFGDIIYRNALPIGDGSVGMTFTWDKGQRNLMEFEAFKSDFKEQGWEFNASAYAGMSGGEEFEIAGLGFGFEMSFLAGGTYATKHDTSQTNTTKWGLAMESDHWNPYYGEGEDVVSRYSFHVYFLPVPDKRSKLSENYWVQELYKNIPLSEIDSIKPLIDRQSGCWRALFVVTEIEYLNPCKKSGRENYSFEIPSEFYSVYQETSVKV
ncbi:MAG: hypothetical protein ABJO36_07855 [Litorimonas sp.]